MDPISQGVVGGIVAQALGRKINVRWAGIVGFIAGLPADLDVFIRSAEDPLLNLEYHRHFTHSLVFIPVGALLVSLALWWFLRKKLTFAQLYAVCFLGYGTSGLLDACTSYGTRLWWPFSNARVAWDNIGIVDPIFTLTLLAVLLVAIVCKRRSWATWGFVFGMSYLLLGVAQRERGKSHLLALAEERGHAVVRYTMKPTVLNLWVWRGIYQTEDEYFVDAYHLGWKTKIYAGESVPVLTQAKIQSLVPSDSPQHRDIARFAHFSDQYLYWIKGEKNAVGDLRYALLPHLVQPLWGIQLFPEEPDRHVHFGSFRVMKEDTWPTFTNMLYGRELGD